jgi:5-keto 4-deoxyuronate isomerase
MKTVVIGFFTAWCTRHKVPFVAVDSGVMMRLSLSVLLTTLKQENKYDYVTSWTHDRAQELYSFISSRSAVRS